MRVEVLGVKVESINYQEAVERVKSWWKEGGRHYVVTPNPEIIMYARSHPDHREILNKADMSVPDGAGVVWASRMLGEPLKGRVTGADLAEKLIKEAAESGETVFFLGGYGGVSEVAARKFTARFPGLKVAGWAEGDASTDGDEGIRKVLGQENIGLLLVAYGHPKQEYWMARNLVHLNVKVAMGIGGAFDYWSGRLARAPGWMRRVGLEWVYRLLREPWRVKRQLALPLFGLLIIREALIPTKRK